MRIRRPAVAALALAATAALRAPAPARVGVEAIPEFGSVAPGREFRVAVRLTIPAGCHVSWMNPGQSGLPTTLAWRTPAGVRAGATEWPFPERDEVAGVVSHVYRGAPVVVTRFAADSALRSGTVALRGELSWGVCGATCLPEKGAVEVSLPVEPGAAEPTAAWRALAPQLDALPVAGASLAVSAAASGDRVRLVIGGPRLAPTGGTAVFFPLPAGAAVVVRTQRTARGVAVSLPSSLLRGHPDRISGVLVADSSWLIGSNRRAAAIESPIREMP